jgi:hypothetical protein
MLGALLAGCAPFGGFVHDEHLGGPYRLVAVDEMEQMGICRSVPDGSGDCVGDGLPSDTVFAAGINAQYLVAARRATRDPFGEAPKNPGAIEYYYVVRTAGEGGRGPPPENIVGPLTEPDFNRARQELGLPEFTRVFEELR